MEQILQKISRDIIKLPDDEKARNNEILEWVLHFIIERMKLTDEVFKEIYQTKFPGGSYYDRLKVTKPDEYDIDLLFILPKELGYKFSDCNKPGNVTIKFSKNKINGRNILIINKKIMRYFIDPDCYLSTKMLMIWFHRVLSTSLRKYRITHGTHKKYEIPFEASILELKVHRNGPAFTLRITDDQDNFIYVDLVPCFKFGDEHWLPNGFKDNGNNMTTKKSFFIVPKTTIDNKTIPPPDHNFRNWRLSFQEQERDILNSKKFLKPAIKLLKRITRKYGHKCIASYYLKTIGLWLVKQQPTEFWENSLSNIFLRLLKAYRRCLQEGRIEYFWYLKKNLIDGIDVKCIYRLINKIVEDIEKQPDSEVIAKYILTKKEFKYYTLTGELNACI